MRGLEPRLVHRPLDRVGEHRVVDLALDRRAAGVPGEGRREHVVLASSAGSTSSHVRQVSVKPCRQTIGEPEPPRWDGVKPEFTAPTLTGAAGGRHTRAVAFAPPARHLLRAKDLADARYFEPLDVDDLARAAGLSRAHFSREFRRAFGESPHAYLLTRRLERAAALLRTTDHSVAEICFSVGLQSVGSFTTSFTRTFGVSPTAYRAALPAGLGAGADPGLRRARLRAPATQHVSRRQRRRRA